MADGDPQDSGCMPSQDEGVASDVILVDALAPSQDTVMHEAHRPPATAAALLALQVSGSRMRQIRRRRSGSMRQVWRRRSGSTQCAPSRCRRLSG